MASSSASRPSLPDNISTLLTTVQDPTWLAQASLAVSAVSTETALVRTALDRAWEATCEWEGAALLSVASEEGEKRGAALREFLVREEGAKSRLETRREIAIRRTRLKTWEALGGARGEAKQTTEEPLEEGGEEGVRHTEEALLESETPIEIDDDPWAMDEDEDDEPPPPSAADVSLPSSSAASAKDISPRTPLPFDLPTFLTAPLVHLALLLTRESQLANLHTLVARHRRQLRPYRLLLLEAIPDCVKPDLFHRLLPRCDDVAEVEVEWATELEELTGLQDDDDEDWTKDETLYGIITSPAAVEGDVPYRDFPLPSAELAAWYQSRSEAIESASGLVDVSLAYVQHAASLSVPSLDSLGEDLSLLSRLVYDARVDASEHADSNQPILDDSWTLSRWRTATPEEASAAYLHFATPDSVVHLIKHLLLPYLYVLLARSERTGKPDTQLPSRHIQNWLLSSASLELAAQVFNASKATLPVHERILKKDEEVARLALALLYGSQKIDRWEEMSAIFETLPAWEFGPEDHEDGEGETTLLALAQFLRPTPSSPPPKPAELHTFFLPLSAPSLSLLLDALDVHLESAETLSRWGVPATMGWFILSAEDRSEQLAWATRMARRGGERASKRDDWESLLRDMRKLRGGSREGCRGAFGMLEEDEIKRIFFGGLLSSGNFALAKSMLNARPAPLDRQTIEALVLAASVEFYENAETGNLHEGGMKLAYSCLSIITPPTPAILRELAFIEATSKLTTYNLPSPSSPQTALSPLEIRLSANRLSLVSQLLSTSEDAYKHPEVILDLITKLDCGGRAARIKGLGMLADSSVMMGDGDWQRGVGYVERMRGEVKEMMKETAGGGGRAGRSAEVTQKETDEAVEVVWKTCFQFGRSSALGGDDGARREKLLGWALEFCPPDTIPDVLAEWRKVEEAESERRKRKREGGAGGSSLAPQSSPFSFDWVTASTSSYGDALSPAPHLETERARKRDIAARAATAAFDHLGSSLSSFRPFSGSSAGTTQRMPIFDSANMESPPLPPTAASTEASSGEKQVANLFGGGDGAQDESDLLHQGRRQLNRSLGWILGANEEEMGGGVI